MLDLMSSVNKRMDPGAINRNKCAVKGPNWRVITEAHSIHVRFC